MHNTDNGLLYLLYFIEKGLISREEINDWADNIILNNKNVSDTIFSLSLAKSLDEQFVIIMHDQRTDKISLENKSIKPILGRLLFLYKTRRKNTKEIINILFHLQFDVELTLDILTDIYILDDSSDYLGKDITHEELDEKLLTFLNKYTEENN